MESLLEHIREIPDFHKFSRPPPFSELQFSAAAGPVVLFNASSYRCNTLIVIADNPPKLVPLPDTSLEDASRIAMDFRDNQCSREFRSSLEPSFCLACGGTSCSYGVGIHCDACQHTLQTTVWWCPTGPFSFIPIHAVGPHTRSGGPDLTKRVLSSYNLTLPALLRARSQYLPSDCRVLLVAQPDTPGQAPLPSVFEEVKLVYEAACLKYDARNVLMLDGHDALRDVVVAKLKDTTCAHFACHGHQEQTGSALQSALFLQGGPLRLRYSIESTAECRLRVSLGLQYCVWLRPPRRRGNAYRGGDAGSRISQRDSDHVDYQRWPVGPDRESLKGLRPSISK